MRRDCVGRREALRALRESVALMEDGLWLMGSAARLAAWALEALEAEARAEAEAGRATGSWGWYVREVRRIVAEELGVREEELTGSGRALRLVWGRNMMMKLLRESRWRPSLKEVGAACGRDHTTVLHGLKSVAKDAAYVPAFRAVWERVRARVAAEIVKSEE